MSATAELDLARVEAIDMSGWGRTVKFFQPRNLAFWVYVLLVASGMATFVTTVSGQSKAYGSAIVFATGVFAVYGALFWWFTQRIDRYSSQPAKMIVLALLWGGFAATWVMAAPANDAIRSLYAKAFGQSWALNWSAGLAAPFTEETAKGIGLLLLIALAPRLVRTAFDGFVLGAFLGLGFQIIEDISYAMNSAASEFGANQFGASISTIVLRMVVGVAAHILYSAVFCTGLVYLIGRPAEPRRVGRGIVLMATAMLLHGLWDSASALLGSYNALAFPFMFVLIVVALVIVTRVFRMTVPTERDFMRDVMAPEVANGVLGEDELEALTGDRKERKKYRKAGTSRADRARRRHVLDAATDLADELGAARGQDAERVQFARAEVARLRGIPAGATAVAS